MTDNERGPQQHSITERLTSAYLSRQSFASAINLAATFDDYQDQIRLNSYIGKCLAVAGCDYSAQLQFLGKIVAGAESKPEREKKSALYGIAFIHLAGNNPQAAFEIASLDGGNRQSPSQTYIDLETARVFVKLGQDPSPAMRRALSNIGETTSDGYVKACDYISLAQTQYVIGVDHNSALTKARALTEKLVAMKPYAYTRLAEAYAATGDPETALQVIDQIQDIDPSCIHQKRNEALQSVSRANLARGDIDAAIKAATQSGSNLLIAEISAKAAIEIAQDKAPKIILIKKASDYVNRPLTIYKKTQGVDGPADYDLAWQAEIYALIDRAKILNGLNPARPFLKSLEIASTIEHDLHRASAYNEVARNQALTGRDARPAWKLALESVGEDLEHSEGNWIGEGLCFIDLEDFTKAQIECGYYDTALNTVEQMIKIEAKDDIAKNRFYELFKAEALADIGLSQAKRGLTDIEVGSLPIDMIRQIMVGSDVKAKEAVVYFGLDKTLKLF